ncbi:MAG TPA: serine hydrolase [Pseudonocardiaceae bacterium]|nr:serine hydrolase [Pseudonocardiaceae bacterium]
MRHSARTPIVTLVVMMCAAMVVAAVAVLGVGAAGAAALPAPAAAPAPVCAGEAAPPPEVDTSEVPAPGQTVPPALAVPASPAGGPQMAGCDLVLPPGAPPLPTDLGASSWVLQDLDTGQILAAKAPHARERPASLIKLLLAQVVVRQLKPDQVITGTQDDANQQGTRVGIGPGGQYSVSLLLHGLLMASGNDIAHSLAMACGGMQVTVDKMNALAKQLGMLDTRAATPSGLDGPGMASSAYDLSVIFRADLNNPLLADAMHTAQIQFPGYGGKPTFTVYNDNHLLTKYPGDFGGKNGYTDDAQHTFADAAAQNGHRIALILMHGTNHLDGMYQNASELMTYGFALANAHTSAVGQLVAASPAGPKPTTLALAGAPTGLVQGHPGGGTGPGIQPPPAMSTFGNVGGPLTAIAVVALLLIVVLYLRRLRAKKAREAAAKVKRAEARKAATAAAMAATERVRPVRPPMTAPPRRPENPSTTTTMTGPIWPTHDQH